MDALVEAVERLRRSFSGTLLVQSDANYEEARRAHNARVDKHPAVIARCRGTADISAAISLARMLDVEVAVKGGGQNVAGQGTVEGGLVIDLSLMKGIHVEPKARVVRAQGGVCWREFNRETQVHALATTGGVFSLAGIAGVTLGGGVGWLAPKYGLALDNLRSAEMVTADGAVLRVSETEHSDLFWAIRGGDGNFGVAASLEYALHPVGPMIVGGFVAHPIEEAVEVLNRFRERCESAPDELMLTAGLTTARGTEPKVASIVATHCGPLADGESAIRSLRTFGSPVLNTMGPISYCEQNALLDTTFPTGTLRYWKSHFLSGLSDEAIESLIDSYVACPSPLSQIAIEHYHGAASRVPVERTACAMRLSGYNVVIIAQWLDPRLTDECVSWCRTTYRNLAPFLGSMRYVNYLDADDVNADDGRTPARVVFGPNYERLRQIKARYDPDNFFHVNVNIDPTG